LGLALGDLGLVVGELELLRPDVSWVEVQE
jgi:hypothetical protein